MNQICKSIDSDEAVTGLITNNAIYMEGGERKVMLNSLQAIKYGSKHLTLNHSEITEFGCQIIWEALK